MTQITGKIYQMTNGKTGANLENRFPRTVMEAVLGLNSYLQDQFSALADIYMPIEGISEAFTGQGFVYRKSPNTIKAKSLTLDRIKGKTLAWNQLAKLNTESSYTDRGITFTKNNDGGVTISGTPSVTGVIITYATFPPTSSTHKLAIREYSSSGNYAICYSNWYRYGVSYNGSWRIISGGVINSIGIYFASKNAINIKVYYQCIDLTLLYGSEIDGLTNEQILAKYEAEYPGYHDYSAGKLISNDVSALETVGFNQWDKEAELGTINQQTGENETPVAGVLRSVNYIGVFPSTAYYIKHSASLGVRLFYYDAAKALISAGMVVFVSGTFTTPANCAYLRFQYSSETYNHDICINLSDSNFNGQYEPYRKVVLPLNLDDFWVKDGQGNQVHITGGLKSAGSVYDEIIGNKDIQRIDRVDLGSLVWSYSEDRGLSFFFVSNTAAPSGIAIQAAAVCSKYPCNTDDGNTQGDNTLSTNWMRWHGQAVPTVRICDSNHTAADLVDGHAAWLEGVMLDYELATPIEYDLAEPLIYTTKAGTTEERISPNSDGLSAPFCCDMTYSANENNDAGNAQYAATAGRLLNTHKIWGQDFNGSEDVSGALTGVTNISMNGALSGLTNINSLINITSGNVGIGTDAPAHKLDVAGTLRATGLATMGGGLTIPNTADAKHGTLDFIDGDAVKHIVVVSREEDIPASPDLHTLYVVATTTV